MRRNIFIMLAVFITVLCAVHADGIELTAEQRNISRAFRLAAEGTPEQLKQAVSEGLNFNVESELIFDEDDNPVLDELKYDIDYEFDSATPLHAAAAKNPNPESIKFLLSLGLDVNAEAESGNTVLETPLTCAIRNKNNINVINVLLQAGADPDASNSDPNYSVFHLVASECKDYAYAKAVIDALVKAGGNVNSRYEFTREEIREMKEREDSSGFRIKWSRSDPFGYAIYNLSRVTRGNFLSSFTPLMYAVLYDNPDVVNILLDAGADPDIRSLENKTALDYAKMLTNDTNLRRSDAFQRLQKVTRQKKSAKRK